MKKNKKTIFAITIGIVFLLILGLSYAYFTAVLDTSGTANQIITEAGSLKIVYTDSPEISEINVRPAWQVNKVVSVENTGSLEAYYSINWKELINEIERNELVLSATCVRTVEGVVAGSCDGISEAPIATLPGSIKENIALEAEVKHTYTFTFKFKDTFSEQNYNQGKNFNGVINIEEYFRWYQECSMGENSNNLNCKMLAGTTPYSEKVNSTNVTGSYYDITLYRFYEGGRAPLSAYSAGTYYHDEYSGINLSNAVTNNYIGEGTWDAGEGVCMYDGNYVVDYRDGIVVENENDCTEVYLNTYDEYIHLDLTLKDDLDTHIASSGEGIDFDRLAGETNGLGLYYTEDTNKTDEGTRVYYYRGAVTDNYVVFASKCWKIIRTNENGSIRLFYWGAATGNTCSETADTLGAGAVKLYNGSFDNAYVGYMHGITGSNNYNDTHRNTNNSLMKGILDSWYTTNLTTYGDYIENAIYCNDRSVGAPGTINGTTYTANGFGTSNTIYGTGRRLFTNGVAGTTMGSNNSSPTFACPNDNDKFTLRTDAGGTLGYGNNALTKPIATITADEIIQSGSVYGTQGTGKYNYLINGNSYHTMSPVYTTNAVWQATYNAAGNIIPMNGAFGTTSVIPVISLKNNVTATGKGEYSTPYVIQTY